MRVRATLASASVVAALGLVIRSLTQVLHRLREAEAAGAAEAARADAEAARKHELACELLTLRNLLISTPASVETRFVPAPSDVFVVGYPRCGTTWVSQIVHALRTGAEVEKTMAFGEISEVVPWDVQAEACGQRLNSPQASVPSCRLLPPCRLSSRHRLSHSCRLSSHAASLTPRPLNPRPLSPPCAQVGVPRAFKSHETWEAIAKAAGPHCMPSLPRLSFS